MKSLNRDLRLSSGLEIRRPWDLLRGYMEYRYPLYDGVEIATDNHLGPMEMALSIMLNSRISGNIAHSIWMIHKEVDAGLAGIPNVNLIGVGRGEEIPGRDGIDRVVKSMCDLPRVKLSTSTKILHKKRPGLIPILDGLIERHYWNRSRETYGKLNWGEYAVAMMKDFHKDLLGVEKPVRELADRMRDLNTPVTECRILEVLMWETLAPPKR